MVMAKVRSKTSSAPLPQCGIVLHQQVEISQRATQLLDHQPGVRLSFPERRPAM